MKPNATDIAAGWPRLVRDVKGLSVRTRRPMTTSVMTVPAGTLGVLEESSAWHRLAFRTDPCVCCGVAVWVHRLSRNDFEIV